jgi:hypothetical protein
MTREEKLSHKSCKQLMGSIKGIWEIHPLTGKYVFIDKTKIDYDLKLIKQLIYNT